MREIRPLVNVIDRCLERTLHRLRVSLPRPHLLPAAGYPPFPTITQPIVRLASRPSRVSAPLRPRAAGLAPLTASRSSRVLALA